MLTVTDCVRKAIRNKAFLKRLLEFLDSHPDWIAIVAFYSALHFVDACLLKEHNIRKIHHEEREREVSLHLPEIYPSYKRLFDLGFRARYMKIEDAPSVEEAKSAIEYELSAVESHVMQIIQ